jgi:hypothetical protein
LRRTAFAGPLEEAAAPLGCPRPALADDLQEIPAGPLEEFQVAVHVGLAEAQRGVGGDAAQAARVHSRLDRRARAVACPLGLAARQMQGQVADLDHPAED